MDYDSDSDGSDSLGLIPPTQVVGQPVGYNSYGRPSMAMNNNTSYEQDHDSSSSSEDDDSDAEEAAPPIVPRGKTFRPPVGDGDSSSSSSEDEGGGNNNSNASKPIAQILHNSNPGVPRGKELRLPGVAPRGKELRPIQKDSDSSDDDSDVPLATMKSKSKSKNGGNNNPSSNGTKKRKASVKSNDSDSSDDDDDACIATIVGGSDDEDAMATNMSNKKVKTSDGSAKKKPGIKKGATLKKDGTLRRKPGPKKGSHKGKSASSNNGPPVVHVGMKHATPEVSAENATAAQAARIALQQKVTSLPHKVSSSHTIRSFGRIKPEYNASALDALYSSPHAIYPVGFSCDRFEFSPIHGRVIKMRCDILDGRELRERRENLKKDKTRKSDSSEPMLLDEKTKENLGDGPVFRVTFGEGVEEEKVMEPSCPFDPYVAAAHLGGNVDAIAVPLSSKKGNAKSSPGLPEIGMRVSVKFDKGKLYGGSITKVNHLAEKLSKNKKALCNITIKYDDGVTEVAAFPDPDIALMAGCPPVETEDGLVTQMNGKSVRSVLAKSPLEAWGKTLLSLGLIDEIMYESALKTLSKVREEGFKEVKDKIDAANKKRREDRAKEKIRHSHGTRQSAGGEDDDKNKGMSVDDNETNADKMDTEKEDQSPEEVELRKKLAEMQNKLEAAKKRSKVASFNLANARIATISPFAANPFLCRDDSSKLETSWMAAAIKNEKAKMGNTGNKKKFVNPATMLDKSDTFFQPKIERLVEGLPGTEFAPSYVFRANRSSSGGNQTWIHEAKIKLQKQQQKKQEKALKSAKHSEAKAKQEQEKLLKRKLHEQQASDRKRLKEEEENKKKRKRVEKRLALLNNQMSDKLFKEACMMREKNIMNFVRGLNKEFARRRKAAEQTVGNKIDQTTSTPSSVNSTTTVLIPFGAKLPPLSRSYEPEVIRVWDFLHSFSDVFSDSRTLLPSLNSIQGAFDCLNANECDQSKRSNAIQLFQGIAIDLCKVISPSLTKILSTSIQNFEVIGKNGTEGGPQEDSDVSCLPVTEWTWREVAKMAIIYDVLTDLGYSKQESANFVKGYRSGGHPKSNEAKRWKKIEESNLVMMYSRIKNNGGDMNQLRSRLVRAIISTPCTSSSVPSDWRFFLHNIKSRSTNSARFIKDNVKKSLAALKNTPSRVKEKESYIADLEKCLTIVERSNNGSNIPELHKAKQLAVRVLDSAREKCSSFDKGPSSPQLNQIDCTQEPGRQKMGFKQKYQMSREQFKALEQYKEEYMAAALKLKEDLERKNMGDANEDEDDDDEDDDAEGKAQGGKDDKEPSVEQKSSTEVTSDDTNNEEKKSDAADESDEAKKVGNDKAVTDATIASPADVAVAESSNTFGHATVGETDKHIPTELAGKDFPDGWVYRRIPRQKANDPRTDRHYYSPKLGLRFRQRSDAMRFLAKLEEAKGDESVAIMKYLGKDKVAVKAASKVTTKTIAKVAPAAAEGDGVREEYDFTQDIPLAPELIRRCLAVVRTLCVSNTSDQFIYPVDPQLYPGYYETVMNPMSLYDIGKYLQEAGNKYSSNHDDPEIEEVVANVGRKVRILVQNSIMVNSSNMIVNSAEEMLRIFERLFFDWVLAPSRPDIEHLDDDRCVHHHESDINSMVLICDACEAKYNMTRLKPVLLRVPKGDWYCPRCVSGRSWLTADPRIGRSVKNESISGTVQSCKFLFTEDGKPSIIYCIKSINSGRIEYWGVEDVDNSMLGDPIEPLRCLQALAESPGYGFGRDSGIVGGAIPLAINPFVGDKAAQAALSSSGVFQDTVSACVYLTNSPEDFTAEEWTALLMLLVTKCSQSDALQELASKLESKEHSRLSTDMLTFWRARAAKNIVSNLSDDDSVLSEEEEPRCEPPSDIPTVIEGKAKTGANESATKREEPPADIVMKSSGEEPTNMEISFSSSKTEALDEASSSTAANATIQSSMKETAISEEEVLRKKRDATLAAKTKRDSKREQALMGYYVGSRLKSTAASFDEDFISTAVKATLCNQEEGLDLPAVRCRESCHYCCVSDVALGAPLFRTPNEQEWREMFPLAVHNRTTFMIAEVPDNSSEDDPFHLGIKSPDKEEKKTKALCVRVRVGGELVSSKNTCIDNTGKIYDSVMQQFLPLNPKGFQSELKYRQRKNLSIISGSVAAHEVCAIAAYKSRKEKLLGERRTFHRSNMTREAALACGKSVPIGNDPFGRSYWVFSAEPSSLFICSNPSQASPVACKEWHRFNKPEDIAAVMVCLGKNPLCETLKEVFPEAKKFMKDRTWSTLIYGRCLAREPDESESQPAAEKPKIDEEQQDYGAPFVEDEDVLVESKEGKFLWDAVVVDVSKDPETERVNGYLVHYKNWSSRFDQWVAPDRVVEPNKINTEVQGEVTQDFSEANDASPPMLEKMFAYQFLNAKKRARFTPATKTDIFETAFARPSASQDEKLLGLLKGAVLLIEAALPRGSVGSSKNGSWDHEAAAAWRNFVKDAQGPESLMKCVLLLEDAISPDWFHSQATQLYASLPKQWRAMGEASLSGIALRVSVLDRCLKYQQRKKKHLD